MFNSGEKTELIKELNKDIDKSKEISKYNQNWDIIFKILVLLISIGIVITSALATSKIVEKPEKWSLFWFFRFDYAKLI